MRIYHYWLRGQTPLHVSYCNEMGVRSLHIHIWRYRLEVYA